MHSDANPSFHSNGKIWPMKQPLPKILLLQARVQGDPVLQEERESFAVAAGLPVEQIVPHNLVTGPVRSADLRRFDALMVGGAGEFLVSQGDLPYFEETLEGLAQLVERGFPTFASCFGFQLLVRALGGEIIYDPDTMQVGTYDLYLTPAGRRDSLFGQLPERFHAQLGRKDRAAQLPGQVSNLAASPDVPFQALRVPGEPIWATQFHPELTKTDNLLRYKRYLDGYRSVMDPEEVRRSLARFRESPATGPLIRGFVNLLFS